jgi:formate dehydrogenase (coenzyme F420) beta subunit
MNVNRVIEVQDGNATLTAQRFLFALWQEHRLDSLLAPVVVAGQVGVSAQVIRHPDELASVDPFLPVMQGNSAAAAWRFIQEETSGRLAVLLRPCELRALVELAKRAGLPASSFQASEGSAEKCVLVIGVDCLGTYTQKELLDAGDGGGSDEITRSTLQNAYQGGLIPQPFRTACQVCEWPAPRGADIVIGTLGVDTEKTLLILACDECLDSRLHLTGITDEPAPEYLVSRRETMVGAVADARLGFRRNLYAEIGSEGRFSDLGSVLAWFANCNLCGKCLKACPIYGGELDSLLGRDKSRTPLADLVLLSHWIASCSGCGMCEEVCARDVPLTLLISSLSHRIREEMHYTAGDPAQKLPWSCN